MLILSGIYKYGEENPYKISMILDNTKVTYGELIKNINQRAKFLSGKFKKGQKIIIKNTNSIANIINFLACTRAGLISVIVDSNILPSTLENIKERIKPSFIIDDKFNYGMLLSKGNKNIYPNRNFNGFLYKKTLNINYLLPKIEDRDIFLGALSSGTTGNNKVVWRDHESWTKAFKYQSEIFHISRKDVLFLVGSLCYTANLNSAIHILNEGGRIVFSKSIYPKAWIKEMKKNNVTSIFMVPAHYRMLVKELKKDMLKVKSILSAGDKMDLETVNILREKFPEAHICEYYGASELGHITYIDYRENFSGETVGKAFPEVKLKIEDDLVWVESPYIAPDFKPKATVGDIGKIDEEGKLYLLGRQNQTINKGGIKIIPYNIEKVLNKHPQILHSVVFGVKHPLKGEEVAAVIIPRSEELTLKNIIEYSRKNLELHCRPQKIKIIKDIKLNSSGKIDRKKMGTVHNF